MHALTTALSKLKIQLQRQRSEESNQSTEKMTATGSSARVSNHEFLECCASPLTGEIKGGKAPMETKYAIIVPSCAKSGAYLKPLWVNAAYRIAVDEGITKVFDAFKEADLENVLPDVILGDLEKQPQAIVKFFQERKVEPIEQNTEKMTDVEKALEYFERKRNEDSTLGAIHNVLIYTPLLNRFDKTLNCLHVQAKYVNKPWLLYCVSEGLMTELLPAGEHELKMSGKFEQQGTHCGLFPLGAPAEKVTTKGLKYNLHNEKLAFGEKVSAANVIVTKHVHVSTDRPLIWTSAFCADTDEVTFKPAELEEPFVEKSEEKGGVAD